MKKFFNAEISATIIAASVEDLLNQIRANGCTVGKKPAQELWDAKRDNAGGFEFVEDVVEGPVDDTPAPTPAPTAGAANEVPAPFSAEDLATAIANFRGPVVTEKPADAPAPAKTPAAPKVVKASAPKGKIKAVRKDTKIARGLEALLGGATMEELLAANIGDDLVDFCNRRVTKRGYGIALADGKVKLVLPEGVVGVAYSG